MDKFIINGGKKLKGEIKVSGAKNAALKIFPVALLSSETIRISNVPDIEDCWRAKGFYYSHPRNLPKLWRRIHCRTKRRPNIHAGAAKRAKHVEH